MGSFIDYLQEKRDGKSAKDDGYSLKNWFGEDKEGWIQCGGKYHGKPCAKQPGHTTKPYCRDPDDCAKLSKEKRNKRAAKKDREDPNPDREGKARNVTQESYMNLQDLLNLAEEKKKGKKDACYHKVKGRYKVWPSAYASGALVKCRKVGAANWGNSTKKESYEVKSFADFLSENQTQTAT